MGMSLEQHREELWRMVMRDHDIISKGIESSRTLFAGESWQDQTQEIELLKRLISKTLVRHFSFEEDQVFPDLLEGRPETRVSQALAELRLEHVAFRERADRLHALLSGPDLTSATPELRRALPEFFADLDKHSAKEDELYLWAYGDLATSLRP
jgi:hypothetical protein